MGLSSMESFLYLYPFRHRYPLTAIESTRGALFFPLIGSPVSFQRAAATFGLETALAYAATGTGGNSRFVAVQCLLEEVAQPVFRVASVSGLAAKTLRKDDHFTPAGGALPGDFQDPVLQRTRQSRAVQIQP